MISLKFGKGELPFPLDPDEESALRKGITIPKNFDSRQIRRLGAGAFPAGPLRQRAVGERIGSARRAKFGGFEEKNPIDEFAS